MSTYSDGVPEPETWPAAAIHRLERQGDFWLARIVDLKRSSELIKQVLKSVSSDSV